MIIIILGRIVYPTLFPRWLSPSEAQWVQEVLG